MASKKFIIKKENTTTRAKIVTPKGSQTSETESDSDRPNSGYNSENLDTFITLLPSETLINTITIDFNNDGYDDEVITVRRLGSDVFTIIPGLFNPETADYDRLGDIPTSISKIRTFSLSGMDLTGDHRNALIYQGVADDENYVMQIYLWNSTGGTGNYDDDEGIRGALVKIGDFVSDGTIFIQQTERSDSYQLSLSKGESFSVWVYESEKTTDEEGNVTVGPNQIQKEYKWNSGSKQYELANEIKVTAGKLAANELSRIQDGTVETFAAFLDGLWYKTSSDDGVLRYIYFNYENFEIILLQSDTQEVYEWDDSKLRHNGIYLYTVNSDTHGVTHFVLSNAFVLHLFQRIVDSVHKFFCVLIFEFFVAFVGPVRISVFIERNVHFRIKFFLFFLYELDNGTIHEGFVEVEVK